MEDHHPFLSAGVGKLSVKGQRINNSGFSGHIFLIPTIQLCHCTAKTDTDMNKSDHVPMKTLFTKVGGTPDSTHGSSFAHPFLSEDQ